MSNEPFTGTYTGGRITFLNPQPEQFNIEDIIRPLSMQCRFNGHVQYFYSIAEHCCLLTDLLWRKTHDRETAFSALMHDASEAYLADIPRPIKAHLPNYTDIETMVQGAIETRFNVEPMCGTIKYYDDNVVRDEAEQLFESVPDWVEQYDRVGIKVNCWSPKRAAMEYRERFKKYSGLIV